MKDLPAEVKKARQSILIKKKEECKLGFVNSMLNKTADFLFEEFKDGYYQGYSENYLRLYIKEYNGSHDIVKVKIIAPYKDGAIAEIQGE